MKLSILSVFIVCITSIFTYKVFRDFQERWKDTETFHETIMKSPLLVRHLLIPPKQLGIDKWYPGDSAIYQLKTNTENKEISFSVAAEDVGGSERHWLRIDGVSEFNTAAIAIWSLLNEGTLHPGSETDGFFSQDGTFVFPFFSATFPRYQIVLENMGGKIVETLAGQFRCQHYFARIRVPNGKFVPLLELWADPSVRPLGVVRARWRDETLELIDVKLPFPVEVPNILSKTSFNHQKIREQGCAQCHHEEIGGKDLRFLSKYSLGGTALNLAQCLFHYYQSGLVNHEEPIHLQIPLESWQFASKEPVRFTWTKGSVWVEPDHRRQLMISLDKIVQQGDITAQPRAGALILNLKK